MRLCAAFAIALMAMASVAGATINVPGTYATIQAAIDSATPGELILVSSLYDCSLETFPINIHTTVTLVGAQVNIDPRPSIGGRTGAETVVDAAETSGAVFRIVSAADVVINGFTITGGTADMVEESGHADGLHFCYNILYDDPLSAGDEGLQVKYSDGVLIECNYVYDTVQDALNLSSSTNGVVRCNEIHDAHTENAAVYCYDATNIDIIENLVYDIPNNDGIKLGDSGDGSVGGMVLDNTVSNCAEDGITVYASGATVSGNRVQYCGSENGALYLYLSHGTVVSGNKMHDNAAIGLLIVDSNDVVVTDNEVYRSDDSDDTKYPGSAGIWLHGTTTLLTLEQNCIVDNVDYGLRNETGAVVTAEDNWWGDASGPYHSTNPTGSGNAVTDNVDFDPWLTTDPCGISPVESTTWGAIKAMYR